MANVTGTLSVTGTMTQLPAGPVAIEQTVILPSAIRSTLYPFNLTSSSQTVSIPAGCMYVLFVPPSGNTKPIQMASAYTGRATPALYSIGPAGWTSTILFTVSPANIPINNCALYFF